MLSSLFKLSVGILFLCVTTNTIAETLQSFTLPLSYKYEGNPTLLVTDELIEPLSRLILIPDYLLLINKGNEQWSLGASLRMERSSNQSVSEDRNDPALNVGWIHEYRTGQFDLNALLVDRSTRFTEFQDSSFVRFDNTRQNRSIFANWLNSIGSRASIAINAEGTSVAYATETLTLNDYQYTSISPRLSYTLNRQVEAFGQFSYLGFDSKGTNTVSSNESNAESIDFGVTWTVSEKANIIASVGLNQMYELLVSNNLVGVMSENTTEGWQGLLNIQYVTLRTTTQINLERSLQPLSAGIVESNQLDVGWAYSLGEREEIALDFRWRERLQIIRIRTMNIIVSYTLQLSSKWDFMVSAENRNRVDSSTLASAYSNSLLTSIIYKIPDF